MTATIAPDDVLVERQLLRNRIHDAVVSALSDEGVLTYDQTTAIGRAIMGAVDLMLEASAALIGDGP